MMNDIMLLLAVTVILSALIAFEGIDNERH